jgi:catechol 2,3-dioxygenase-like lactoylglutathione lyase family enzyme
LPRDYEEAIAWFGEKLGFTLVADEYQPEQDKRWVLVAPPAPATTPPPSSSPAPPLRSRPQPGGRARLLPGNFTMFG